MPSKRKLPPGVKRREPVTMTTLNAGNARATIAQQFINRKFSRQMQGKNKTLVVLGITEDLSQYIVGVLRYASRPIRNTNNLMLLLKLDYDDLPKVLSNPEILHIEGLTKPPSPAETPQPIKAPPKKVRYEVDWDSDEPIVTDQEEVASPAATVLRSLANVAFPTEEFEDAFSVFNGD